MSSGSSGCENKRPRLKSTSLSESSASSPSSPISSVGRNEVQSKDLSEKDISTKKTKHDKLKKQFCKRSKKPPKLKSISSSKILPSPNERNEILARKKSKKDISSKKKSNKISEGKSSGGGINRPKLVSTSSDSSSSPSSKGFSSGRNEIRSKCLSKKDISAENYLIVEVERAFRIVQAEGKSHSEDSVQRMNQIVLENLIKVSPTMATRLQPMLRAIVAQRHHEALRSSLSLVPVAQLSDEQNIIVYQKRFFSLFDDDNCVSFAVSSKNSQGGLSLREVFYLSLFAFANCRRSQGDHLLQLMLSGESTTGKSTLVEDILLERGHNVTTDQGVGRFSTGERNLILLHDADIVWLCKGPDADKYKTIARGETTTVKVHSATAVVPPLFLLVTSNKRFFDHRIGECDSFGRSSMLRNFFTENKVKIADELISPFRNRFLECHIRKRAERDPSDLRMMTRFNLLHFTVGVYDRILAILESHSADDFVNENIARYCLVALWDQAELRARYHIGGTSVKNENSDAVELRRRVEAARVKLCLPSLFDCYLVSEPKPPPSLSRPFPLPPGCPSFPPPLPEPSRPRLRTRPEKNCHSLSASVPSLERERIEALEVVKLSPTKVMEPMQFFKMDQDCALLVSREEESKEKDEFTTRGKSNQKNADWFIELFGDDEVGGNSGEGYLYQ